MADVHGLQADDCVLMPAPCAHISGLLNGVTLAGVVPFRTVFMARWEPEIGARPDRTRTGHVHDRPADVLRVAHAGARLRTGTGREPAAHLVGWCRGERGVRRRRIGRVRRGRETHVRLDRGAHVSRRASRADANDDRARTRRACDRRGGAPRRRRRTARPRPRSVCRLPRRGAERRMRSTPTAGSGPAISRPRRWLAHDRRSAQGCDHPRR